MKLPRFLFKGIVLIIFLLFLINFFYYLHMYWRHTPIEYSKDWQYGYKEAVSEVKKIEKDFDKIIVTYYYDQPYIYFLFFQPIGPDWYQQQYHGEEIKRANRKFGKYEFRNINWGEDSKLNSVIIVGAEHEIPKEAQGLYKEILFPDGKVAFRIVAKN